MLKGHWIHATADAVWAFDGSELLHRGLLLQWNESGHTWEHVQKLTQQEYEELEAHYGWLAMSGMKGQIAT